jgi:hypothetical protein
LGAAAAFLPRAAWANPPSVRLTVAHCQSLDAPAIQRIFSADLGTSATNESGPEVTEVNITCEGDHVAVRVLDPISRKTLRRSFDPRSFGKEAQSRIVAIAASELVLASWAELAENPAPQVPPEGPAPSPGAVETARNVVRQRKRPTEASPAEDAENPSRAAPAPASDAGPPSARATAQPARGALPAQNPAEMPPDDDIPRKEPSESTHEKALPVVDDRLTAVVSFRSLFRGNGTLWGAGARFGRERKGVVSYAADALIESGTLNNTNATSVSAGAWLCFYKQFGPATFRLGGGLRLGVLGFDDGATASVWGWPMLVASQTLRIDNFIIELSGETGFVNALARNGSPPIRGGWASGQVGLGMAL